jgi:hypothetical protein
VFVSPNPHQSVSNSKYHFWILRDPLSLLSDSSFSGTSMVKKQLIQRVFLFFKPNHE